MACPGPGVAVLAWLCVGGPATAETYPVPQIDDAAILKVMPGAAYTLPKRIYTDAFVACVKAKTHPSLLPPYARADRAATWLAIPDAGWIERISDFAAVSTKGTNIHYGGRCPFTGNRYYRGSAMTDEAFVATPFQARTVEGDHVIYAREADMPADYRWRPSVTIRVPHLDGSMHAYRFFSPKGTETAPPKFNSERKHWLCPAGEVWRCRLDIIMRKVFPDLCHVVFQDGNERAARILAAILDRFADVYPGLPLYSQFIAHGFARNRDKSGYLTRDDYLAAVAEGPFRSWDHRPYWFHSIYDYNYCKLNYGVPGWTDGVLAQLGTLAVTFDLIRERAAVRAFSREKYGDAGAWEAKVRTRLLSEAARMARVTPPTLGNTSYGYIRGAVTLGIVAQDQTLFDRGLEIVETYLPNNWLDDGMANDGAFNYAMMTYGIIGYRWMNKRFGGLDLKDRYPFLETVERLGNRPVRTLFNIGSKHSDQHALFFRHRRPWMGQPEPGKLPYGEHEVSQCMPSYGLTCLRAGAPGSRMELILDHQNTPNHVHFSKLNIQLFYEGVELLPDFGYSVGYIEPDKAPWKDLKYPFELMGSPCPADKWGPWRHGYAMLPEAHCVATVDYWLQATVPMQMHAYLGGMRAADPGYWAQFVDASGRWLFDGRPNPVDVFRRQLLVLTLPGGRSLAVDVFRIRGGARHDLYWHVPSDPVRTTLGAPKPIAAKNLQAYLGLREHYDKLTGKTTQHYGRAPKLITKLESHAVPTGVWRTDYHVQPHKFLPTSKAALKRYSVWPKLLHDVHLRLWGSAWGSATTHQEIIGARGPWPGILDEVDPRTGTPTKNALVGFKDALHFLIPSRVSAKPGLESTFVHVLEPRNPDQPEVVAKVEVLDRQPMGRGGAAVAQITLTDGSHAIVATTLDGKPYRGKDVTLEGRLGVVIPETGTFCLYDGTRYSAGGWSVEVEPTWQTKLVGVIGDLTGRPKESALVVASPRALPTDNRLVGRMLFVQHQANPRYTTGYTIRDVAPYGPGRYRIDLRDTPPFIQHRMRIWKVDDKDPSLIFQDFRMFKGSRERNYEDRRARFLRSGFDAPIAWASWTNVKLKKTPPPGAVKPGDPVIMYTIQPGDRVVIPSHAAGRGKRTPKGLVLDLSATGGVTVRAPRGASIALTPADMPHGQATVRLP